MEFITITVGDQSIISKRAIKFWIARMGLKLADYKTDVILISSRKEIEFITITVGDQSIISNNVKGTPDVHWWKMCGNIMCVCPNTVEPRRPETGSKTITDEGSDIDCNICSRYTGPCYGQKDLSSLKRPTGDPLSG